MSHPASSPAASRKNRHGEVQRIGNVRGVVRSHDDHLEVVAASPDPAVHAQGDGRAFLRGEAALELAR